MQSICLDLVSLSFTHPLFKEHFHFLTMESSRVALFTRIEQNISEIEVCITHIRKRQTRIVSSPFHDEADYNELDKLMVKVQSLSNHTWTLLKAAKENKHPRSSVRRSTIRMENVQINRLYQKFVDVLADYSNAQSEFKDRRKKLLRRQLEITGQQNISDDELEKMLEENKAVFTHGYIVEVERTREDLTYEKKRCSQILRIENSLREVDDMLLSLSILINSQGEILDSVEEHVMQASEDIIDGNKDLEKAAKKKSQIRKTKIAVITSLLVAAGILVIVLIFI